jgi:hypothetical protein
MKGQGQRRRARGQQRHGAPWPSMALLSLCPPPLPSPLTSCGGSQCLPDPAWQAVREAMHGNRAQGVFTLWAVQSQGAVACRSHRRCA